jgi:hypothetical protein
MEGILQPASRQPGLHALGIPRLDRETNLSGLRPEIPLSELTASRLDTRSGLAPGQ